LYSIHHLGPEKQYQNKRIRQATRGKNESMIFLALVIR